MEIQDLIDTQGNAALELHRAETVGDAAYWQQQIESKFAPAPVYGVEAYLKFGGLFRGAGLTKVAAFFYPSDSAAPYPALMREDGKVVYLGDKPLGGQ